jgi:hypothetical protein
LHSLEHALNTDVGDPNTTGQLITVQGKSSVVDWHCFDGYPDPNPTFHFDAAPDVGNREKI